MFNFDVCNVFWTNFVIYVHEWDYAKWEIHFPVMGIFGLFKNDDF